MKRLFLSFFFLLFTLSSNVVWSNPGFKNLIPGETTKQINHFCNSLVYSITPPLYKNAFVQCYGIDNIKFKGFGKDTLLRLTVDMGPIVASDGSFFSQLNNLVVSTDNEANIYLKMKKNLDAKYVLNYEYSERDRQLFNEGEKEDLLGVYSNGQVVLRITLKERDNSYSKDLWLYIEYRDVDLAKSFLEKNRPVTATLDDF